MKKNSLAFTVFAAAMLVGTVAHAECNSCLYRDENDLCVAEKCDSVDMNLVDSLDGTTIDSVSNKNTSSILDTIGTGSTTTTTTTTVTPVTSCPDGTKKSSDSCCCIPV